MTNGAEDLKGTLNRKEKCVIWESSTRKIIWDHGGLKMTWDKIAFNNGLYPSNVLITSHPTVADCANMFMYYDLCLTRYSIPC